MLLIDQISNDKENTLKGLEKRGFKNLGVVDEIIELNNIRKKTQQELDQILFESNNIDTIIKLLKFNHVKVIRNGIKTAQTYSIESSSKQYLNLISKIGPNN